MEVPGWDVPKNLVSALQSEICLPPTLLPDPHPIAPFGKLSFSGVSICY